MSYTFYSYSIYIQPDSNADLDVLKDNIEAFYSNDDIQPVITLAKKQLTLSFGDYNFYITLSDAPQVMEEAAEIAAAYQTDWNEEPFDQQKLSTCNRRFELWADDDEDMDYMNDSLFILQTIESFKGVTVFHIN